MKKANVVFTLWAVFAAFIVAGQSLYLALHRLPIQFRNTSTHRKDVAVLQTIPTNAFGVVSGWFTNFLRPVVSRQLSFGFYRRVTFGVGWVSIDIQSKVAEAAFDFLPGTKVTLEFQDFIGKQVLLEFLEGG